MYDKSLVFELMHEIEEAFSRIDRRFSIINNPDDFVSSDDGLDRLDAMSYAEEEDLDAAVESE